MKQWDYIRNIFSCVCVCVCVFLLLFFFSSAQAFTGELFAFKSSTKNASRSCSFWVISSPDVILCSWLGSKHQLTNLLSYFNLRWTEWNDMALHAVACRGYWTECLFSKTKAKSMLDTFNSSRACKGSPGSWPKSNKNKGSIPDHLGKMNRSPLFHQFSSV